MYDIYYIIINIYMKIYVGDHRLNYVYNILFFLQRGFSDFLFL